jgi:uncharacterized damage-inducible protein DinB
MQMKQYLIDTFHFNDLANKQALAKMKELPEKEDASKFFSHMINSMNKWMARLLQDPEAAQKGWWKPFYAFEDLEKEWNKSLKVWLDFIGGKSEEEMFQQVEFIGFDGGRWGAQLKDIALQLNYHSIHHRAQIQYLIRKQGIEPEFVDYIATTYKKIAD